MSENDPVVVQGGGLTFLTSDLFLKVAIKRCAQLQEQVQRLEQENRNLRHHEVARYHTLRRDVSVIKSRVCAKESPNE